MVYGHRDSVSPALDLKQQESSCRDMLQVQRWVPTNGSFFFNLQWHSLMHTLCKQPNQECDCFIQHLSSKMGRNPVDYCRYHFIHRQSTTIVLSNIIVVVLGKMIEHTVSIIISFVSRSRMQSKFGASVPAPQPLAVAWLASVDDFIRTTRVTSYVKGVEAQSRSK